MVRANAMEDNVVLYKMIKGVRTSLDIMGRKGGYGFNVAYRRGNGTRCAAILREIISR